MMDLLIRPYQADDFDAVTKLWRQAREVSVPEFQRTKGYPFEMDCIYFREHILPENQVWVVEAEQRPIAFMAIKDDFIDHLYVAPPFWRLGIGRALLTHARTLSPGRLRLFTLQINTNARAFYEKNGFRVLKFGISPAPESEPDIEYLWTNP
ncbi:MAG TPA: GNAT family N-acetyltransferase [Phototrophicaceae bacterium]|nr:GNAT family N-acetyltransferase [Phototrophicaceae bacterium]